MIGNRFSVVLLTAVVALGVFVAWLLSVESRGDAPLAASPTPVPVALATDPSTSRRVLPLDELTQTLERPLFVRSRRPPPVDDVIEAVRADAPQQPTPTALSIELSAVVLETERQYALFRQTAQDRLLKIELGREIEGWVVREIRADGVRLERGTQTQELLLRTFKPPVASAPVRAKPRRRTKAAEPSVSPATTKRRPRRPLRGPRQRPVVRQ
ncbi:MAG: hypothetical protein ACI9DC_000147 [Gammaproteobacteria bacterium]